MHVFVSRELPGGAVERLRATHSVAVWPGSRAPTPDELREALASADAAIVLLTDRIDAGVLDGSPRLAAVSNYAAGYENIDVAAATERGVPVGNTPNVLTAATAQFALALTLDLLRRVSVSSAGVRRGEWSTWEPTGFLGRDLRDTTVGIVGHGRIGRGYGELARALGMTVVATGTDVPLGDVLDAADVLSLHVPLTPATRGLIGRGALARLRPGAILVNTARGAVVDTVALADALESGHLGGAALDVTDPEPLPAGHRLLGLDTVLVTPHIASATLRSRSAMADRAVDNVLAALGGRPMPSAVNSVPVSRRLLS